ncbi:MAG: PTS fructose transporter subunit IIA [Pseudomonadota bacterium]
MIGILLVTHNGLGESLVDCVRHVMGKVPTNIRVLSVLAEDDPQSKEVEGRALIAELDTGQGVLLLADMLGATPCNVVRRLYQRGKVEGVVGVNLPMLLRTLCYCSNRTLTEMVLTAVEGGRNCIVAMRSEEEMNREPELNVAARCIDN